MMFDPFMYLVGRIIYANAANEKESNNYKGKTAKHGTHVAGIIGAIANNYIGLSGIVRKGELIVYDLRPNSTDNGTDTGRCTDTMMNGVISYHGTYVIVSNENNFQGTRKTLVFTWDGDTSTSINMSFVDREESLIINGAEYRKLTS